MNVLDIIIDLNSVAAQFRNFIKGQGLCWAFAALLSTLKAFIRSSPDRRIFGK